MSDSWEALDVNNRGSLTAVSSVDDKTIVRLVADPVTGALLTSGGGAGNNFIYNEVVSGSGTTFTLVHTPISGLQAIYARGQKLLPGGVDYTIAAAVITTMLTWSTGDISADYQY